MRVSTTRPASFPACIFRRSLVTLFAVLGLHSANYSVTAAEAAPQIQWQKSFGGSSDEWLQALQKTSDGGYIFGGPSSSAISGNKTSPNYGNYDYWVVKVDANGDKVWENSSGGSDHDELWCIQPTTDGGYILGGYSASGISGNKTAPNLGGIDYWIIRLNGAGNKLWEKTFGGTGDDYLYSIQPTTDGGYILGGSSASPVSGTKTNAGFGSSDWWIIKLDASGQELWQRTYGGSSDETLRSMCPTSDGGYLLGGESASDVSGNKTAAGHGGRDFWVMKIDANGNDLWQNSFGGSAEDSIWSLLPVQNGYLLGGPSASFPSGNKSSSLCYATTAGAPDFWVVKLDSNGFEVWQHSYGGNDGDSLFSLQEAKDGYILGGSTSSGATCNKTTPRLGSFGSFDAWLVKTDANGAKVWETGFGGNNGDVLQAMQRTTNGYVLGCSSSSTPSGNKTSPNYGSYDFWIVKLEGPPVITLQPRDQTITLGEPATFSVTANGAPPLTYQWLYNGSNILGAVGPTLTLYNTTSAQAGFYSVVVSNEFGSTTCAPARLMFNFLSINMYAGVRIDGRPGETYRIDYNPGLWALSNWQTLSTLTLTNSTQLYFDVQSPHFPYRFYRAVLLP
jgi:hypothetical protein